MSLIFWLPFFFWHHCRCRCNTGQGSHFHSLHPHHSMGSSPLAAHYSSHHSQVNLRCSMNLRLIHRIPGQGNSLQKDTNRLLDHNHRIRRASSVDLLGSAVDAIGSHGSDRLDGEDHAVYVDHVHARWGGAPIVDEEGSVLGDPTGVVLGNEDVDHVVVNEFVDEVHVANVGVVHEADAFVGEVHVDCDALVHRVDYDA